MQDFKGPTAVPEAVNQRALVVNQRSATCFECGRKGHFKKYFPKLKNQNHGNKPVIPKARGKAYAIDGGDANPRSNIVTDFKGPTAVPEAVNQRALVVNQRSATCFECGRKGHFKKYFPKLKNQNHGNKPVIPKARGKAYAIDGGDANPRSNIVTGMFLLNNHYAIVLFDLGANRSFMSTYFSTLLDIIPDTLDVSYAVKLADKRIAETNTLLRGCTIGLLGHPFNIDFMPVEISSFDVIINMD
nr:hypothetical protein [Tanacetum cinerariifolium]